MELAAQVLNCEPCRIAKTLSFMVDGHAILIMAAGDAKIFGTKAKMLTPDETETLIGHAVGGVCPFSISDGMTVYRGKLEVTSHINIDDEVQTVTLTKPEIKATATVDGEKEVDSAEEITLTDTVTYSGLTPGKTYTLSGILMDKETGESLLVDDKEIAAEAEFTPEQPEGTVFTFDASGLAGKLLVVFEALYRDSIEVTTHTGTA